ncbi:heparan-alpha-glucosaminide N-acetyltransferase domain-containing protein [Dactylosporangium sp. NPDC050688]|uniref:heparan-alpha-glucosaminide N-acetyltransferase domain-containing protein n=1 Tax=Dactylosporangium sp. NPDC050688 TaxID=3157217 RepID=UPI003408A103
MTKPANLVAPTPSAPAVPAAAPRGRQRLIGVDAARGAALLGMICLHALYEADAAGNPTWSALAFSGRAAAAFALLAGVGIAFVSGRRQVTAADRPAVAAAMATRAVAIGVVGFLVCAADTVLDAVILPYYAVVFLLAIPLLFLRTRTVAVVGLFLATAGPVAGHFLLPRLPESSLGNPSFARLVEDPAGMLTELTLTGFYPSPTWLAYVCAGIVIGRQDLTRPRFAALLLAGGTVVAVWANAISSLLLHRFGGLAHIWAAQPGSGLTVEETKELLAFGGNGNAPSSTWWWLAVNTPHMSTPPDMFGAAGCAVALLGLLLLAGHITHRVLGPLCTVVLVCLASAGSMTLTLYSAHILFINSEFDTYSAANGCLVQVVGAVLIGLAVRGTIGRGPIEAGVTALATLARRWAASRSAATAGAPVDRAVVPGQAVPARVPAAPAPRAPVMDALVPPASAPSPDAAAASDASGPAVPGVPTSGGPPGDAASGGSRSDGAGSGGSAAGGPSAGGPSAGGAASGGAGQPSGPRRPRGFADVRRRIARRRSQPSAGQGSGR